MRKCQRLCMDRESFGSASLHCGRVLCGGSFYLESPPIYFDVTVEFGLVPLVLMVLIEC